MSGAPAATSSVATCPTGYVLTGGGGKIIPPDHGTADITETIPLEVPVGQSPTQWRATAAWDNQTTGAGGSIQAYAVCARAG
jgi:hypothetical protein